MTSRDHIITSFWSDEDQEFIAICEDHQDYRYLSWIAPTRAAAVVGLEVLLDAVIEDVQVGG